MSEEHRSKIGRSETFVDFTEKLIAAGFILISLILSGLAAIICAPFKALWRIIR